MWVMKPANTVFAGNIRYTPPSGPRTLAWIQNPQSRHMLCMGVHFARRLPILRTLGAGRAIKSRAGSCRGLYSRSTESFKSSERGWRFRTHCRIQVPVPALTNAHGALQSLQSSMPFARGSWLRRPQFPIVCKWVAVSSIIVGIRVIVGSLSRPRSIDDGSGGCGNDDSSHVAARKRLRLRVPAAHHDYRVHVRRQGSAMDDTEQPIKCEPVEECEDVNKEDHEPHIDAEQQRIKLEQLEKQLAESQVHLAEAFASNNRLNKKVERQWREHRKAARVHLEAKGMWMAQLDTHKDMVSESRAKALRLEYQLARQEDQTRLERRSDRETLAAVLTERDSWMHRALDGEQRVEENHIKLQDLQRSHDKHQGEIEVLMHAAAEGIARLTEQLTVARAGEMRLIQTAVATLAQVQRGNLNQEELESKFKLIECQQQRRIRQLERENEGLKDKGRQPCSHGLE